MSPASVLLVASLLAQAATPAPPGFPPFADPPRGWHSSDVPPDQVGGYFVSVLRLTP